MGAPGILAIPCRLACLGKIDCIRRIQGDLVTKRYIEMPILALIRNKSFGNGLGIPPSIFDSIDNLEYALYINIDEVFNNPL